jgi:phosphatidylserine decarboxylase
VAGLGRQLALGALRRLPLHSLSHAAGRMAAWPLPGPIRVLAIRAFGRALGANFDEVRDTLDSFESLQAFFTRALTDGARPIEPATDAFVAPCDGSWGASGEIDAGTLLQMKGRPYSVGALLGSDAEAKRYDGGSFATFYLSPRDYHRFHMPCAGRVLRASYLPGSLWPVNRIGVEGVDGLFAENERICATFGVGGDARITIAAVGATLVGKVRVVFDDLTTQLGDPRTRQIETRRYDVVDPRYSLAKGQEWGRFEFGSTLVLVATPGAVALDAAEPGSPLRLGTRIGTLAA